MWLSTPLKTGSFIKRYKRFFADVEIDGKTVTAHVPNTGSLKTCLHPGLQAVVTTSDDPKRKLKATLQLLQTPTGWVGVNTQLANALVKEAWEQKVIADWVNLTVCKPEFKISAETRLDFLLAPDEDAVVQKQGLHFVEVKNVTMVDGDTALFPDAITERGQKHLKELIHLSGQGHRAEILFVIQRDHCKEFHSNAKIDPEYSRLLAEAAAAGVIIRAFGCTIDPDRSIQLNPKAIPVTWPQSLI